MANKEFEIIQTPALGRPFRLGMLYDRVHDNIIPGETLLTMKDMENHTYQVKRGGCSSEIIYDDSLENKSTAYNGDANLELNIMKGAAALGASGKFLKHDKSSKKELNMSLTAEYTMMYKEVEMKQFESIISNTKTNATHIVAAIEYGTKVTFTFKRTLSVDEDALKISGELKGMLEKIPCLSIAGSISGGMEQTNNKTTENISCKYCGDVILPENPTTYEEAVVCYRQLPKYFKEDGEVPVTVWLYPIPKQSSPASTIVQAINKEKMKQAVRALEDLQRIHVSCNDLMSGHAYALIPEVQRKIENFRRIVQAFQEEFQEQALGELLKEDNRTRRRMSYWLEEIAAFTKWISQNAEREIDLLNVYINEIKTKNIEILPLSSVDAKLFEYDDVMILDIILPFSDARYQKQEKSAKREELAKRQEHAKRQELAKRQEQELQEKQTKREEQEARKELSDSEESDDPDGSVIQERRATTYGWYTDIRTKIDIRNKIKSLGTLNSIEHTEFKFFVTFTDTTNVKPEDVGYTHAVVYRSGEILNSDFDILDQDVASAALKNMIDG